MNKQEIIEALEELKTNISDQQGEPFMLSEGIDNIDKGWNEIRTLLVDADSYLDECIDCIERAIEIAYDLPDYEYTTTYARMAQHIRNRILCNKICEIDEDFCASAPDKQSNDGEPMGEPMQFYLTDCTNDDVDWLCENYDRVYFSYSVKLELWVLMVDHWGSSWDIVEIGTHNEHDAI